MKEMFLHALETIKMYNGSYILFLLSVICIIVFEKKKDNRILIWYMVCAIGIFLCPVATYIIINYCTGPGVYWRYIWIIPIGAMIAYGLTLLLYKINNKFCRIICVCAVLWAIITSGNNMYTSGNFRKAENLYKMPQAAIEIGNELSDLNIEEPIALPETLRYYVRQYDASIRVLYTRMMNHTYYITLNEEISKENPNAILIDELMIKSECRYVVIMKNDTIKYDMESVGYSIVGDTTDYYVFVKEEE